MSDKKDTAASLGYSGKELSVKNSPREVDIPAVLKGVEEAPEGIVARR